jgi:hypothetical protein
MHGLLPYPEAPRSQRFCHLRKRRLASQAAGAGDSHRGRLRLLRHHVPRLEEYLDFRFVPAQRIIAERARMSLTFYAISFILGLGYVMGLRSSMILYAGIDLRARDVSVTGVEHACPGGRISGAFPEQTI